MGGRGSASARSSATFGADGIPTNRRFKDGKETTASARAIMARDPEMGVGDWGNDSVRNENARQAMISGQREAIKIGVNKDGRLHVMNGRHRLKAAADLGVHIRVKWYG